MCYQYFVCVIYSSYSRPLCVIRICFVFVMLFFIRMTHMSLLKMRMLKCLNFVTRQGRHLRVTWMRKSFPMMRYNVVRSKDIAYDILPYVPKV